MIIAVNNIDKPHERDALSWGVIFFGFLIDFL